MQQGIKLKRPLYEFAPDEINHFNQNNSTIKVDTPNGKNNEILFSPAACAKQLA